MHPRQSADVQNRHEYLWTGEGWSMPALKLKEVIGFSHKKETLRLLHPAASSQAES